MAKASGAKSVAINKRDCNIILVKEGLYDLSISLLNTAMIDHRQQINGGFEICDEHEICNVDIVPSRPNAEP